MRSPARNAGKDRTQSRSRKKINVLQILTGLTAVELFHQDSGVKIMLQLELWTASSVKNLPLKRI